jgi:hypothetical protein
LLWRVKQLTLNAYAVRHNGGAGGIRVLPSPANTRERKFVMCKHNKVNTKRRQKFVKVGAIVLATLAMSETGNAENLTVACAVVPCVVDSHHNRIGVATDGVSLLRPIGSLTYRMEYQNTGFITGVNLYYTDAACSSQPYLWTGNLDGKTLVEGLPYYAPSDGVQIWGPTGAPVAITPKGFRYSPPLSACLPLTSDPIVAHPAKVLETTTFYPPFSVQ